MKKNNLTLKEICEQAYGIMEARGYAPMYHDEEHSGFSCSINDVDFSMCSLEDGLFWFGAVVGLEEAPSEEGRASLEALYMQTEPEEVIFENLHIDGADVHLSSAFPTDLYETEMIDLVIKTLERPDGIVGRLKDKQKS